MAAGKSFVPMFIIGGLFFIFGFVTWLNGSLIPFLKIICELSEFEALFVTFAFYIAYTVMAFPMAFVLERVGYKNGMILGLFIMAVGALMFIPSAQSASFMFFLSALFVLGSGLTLLQTASNPYVVHLGDIKSAAMRISVMGVINKSAGVLAPLLFTLLVFSDMPSVTTIASADKELMASKLIAPYMYMALMLLALVALVRFSPLPELELEQSSDDTQKSIFAFPRVVLGAVALFFYVGIEVIAGDTIGLYAQSLGVENATALTSYTMVFMVLGYIVGIFCIPKYLSQQKALLFSALFGILFILGIVLSGTNHTFFTPLPDTVLFVALLGFANALVWPTIWPLALEGIGAYSAKASALLITSIAGGALLPLLFGKIASFATMQGAYLLGIGCYLFILFYALRGHKIVSWRNSNV
ncbi:MAG: sugar MFS transporter [Sulfurimonas sp.]|uniref:sugar MFS transporter n=1 Tax=Sulfurimonas sp. TaxID=2022749 RepID=UPI0026370FCC|nr:sugar MFS transporter [Sulfurimonas sp.]MDD2651950.1 sugar MFS transporter [Sulfurimonas sp.]MDD3451924.1 sugar MFS transporter [Sulfurimonas sp.]